MQGFLNIDKSPGWSSFDSVKAIAKLCPRGTKLGHAGTLDPLATGVLVVAVGRATRLISYAQNGTKTYRGEFLLGRTSDTEDTTGIVVEVDGATIPSREEIKAALPSFIGNVMQRPPAYSAIKVDGERSYDRARRGEQFELTSRPVRIDSIELLAFEYPRFELRVVCGKGTYIRSLGRDIGESLGSGAVMSQLCRERVGGFGIEEAVTIEKLRADGVEPFMSLALNAIDPQIPRVELDKVLLWRLLNGQVIDLPVEQEEAAILWEGQLISIARRFAPGQFRAGVNLRTTAEVFPV